MLSSKSLTWGTLLALMLCADLAVAKDRSPEPRGIVVNGFVLHPGAELSIGYDRYDNTQLSSGDGLVNVGVHFKTSLQDQEFYSWNNNISFNWAQYWGFSEYGDANGGPVVSVSSSADLFKKSLFRLNPSISYRYDSEAEDSNLNAVPDNHSIKAGTYVTLQPGGGAILSERIGYHLFGVFYSDDASIYSGTSSLNHFEHKLTSYTRWEFLTDTHMALDVDFRILSFLDDYRSSNVESSVGVERENPMGLPLRIKASFGGLFTQTLSFDLGAGYTYIYYNIGKPRHSWLLNARLRYDIRPNVGFAFTYKKDFETSAYADYYSYHRVSFDVDALWFEHFQTDASFSYGYYDYMMVDDESDFLGRNDHLLSANLNFAYHFFSGLSLGVTYRYRQVITDMEEGVSAGDYDKHRVSLKLTYEY